MLTTDEAAAGLAENIIRAHTSQTDDIVPLFIGLTSREKPRRQDHQKDNYE